MVDTTLLTFAFIQGVFAFFAPCAVSLLPGYLSAFVTRNTDSKDQTTLFLLKQSLLFASLTILGIITIYGIATGLILAFREVIKSSLVYIAMALGVGIIVVGIFMLFNKPLSLPLKSPALKAKSKHIEAYLFGITFGIGVLGCLFPFFLTVALAAIQAPTLFEGSSYLIAYIVGMSLLMIVFYVLAQFAKVFLQKSLRKILPYMNRVGGLLIIIAGIYIIWYQSALLIF